MKCKLCDKDICNQYGLYRDIDISICCYCLIENEKNLYSPEWFNLEQDLAHARNTISGLEAEINFMKPRIEKIAEECIKKFLEKRKKNES